MRLICGFLCAVDKLRSFRRRAELANEECLIFLYTVGHNPVLSAVFIAVFVLSYSAKCDSSRREFFCWDGGISGAV